MEEQHLKTNSRRVEYSQRLISSLFFWGIALLFAGCAEGDINQLTKDSTQAELSKPSTPKGNQSKATRTSLTDTKCLGPFKVNQLISEHKEQPVAFDVKYKGKCISVYGAPTKMGTTLGYDLQLSPYEVDYKGDRYDYETDGINVSANFPKEEGESLASVKLKGKIVKVTGTLSSILDNVSFNLTNSKLDPDFEDPEFQAKKDEYDARQAEKIRIFKAKSAKNQPLINAALDRITQLREIVDSQVDDYNKTPMRMRLDRAEMAWKSDDVFVDGLKYSLEPWSISNGFELPYKLPFPCDPTERGDFCVGGASLLKYVN